jgi:hypothetical protein
VHLKVKPCVLKSELFDNFLQYTNNIAVNYCINNIHNINLEYFKSKYNQNYNIINYIINNHNNNFIFNNLIYNLLFY